MENIKKTPQIKSEAVVQRCSLNKVFLEISQNFERHLFKKETLTQVFSREFCEVYKSTFVNRTPLAAASVKYNFMLK